MPGVESQRSSASNGGLFSSTSPESGSLRLGQKEPKAPIDVNPKEMAILSRAILSDVLGYDLWLKERNPNEFCVDMDETPATTRIKPISEAEAIPAFKEHIKNIESLGENPSDILVVTHDRLIAQVTFREEIARTKAGEPKTPYDQYLRLIDGFGEKDVDKDVLEEGREHLITCVSEIDLPMSTDGEGLRSGLRNYNERNALSSPKEVETFYFRYAERFRQKFASALGVNLSQVDYKFATKYRDEFWKFYERPGKSGNALWMNWHERHRQEFNIGLVEAYAPHEESHFDIGEVIHKEISEGRLEDIAGLITIPGPDSYYLEGLALTAHDWAGFNFTADGELGAAIYKLEKMALVKGFYLVEHGVDPKEATRDIARYIPVKTLDQIEHLLIEGTTDPFARAYQVVYGRAVMDFDEVANNLNHEKRIIFLKEVAKKPRTRNQIKNLISDILVA